MKNQKIHIENLKDFMGDEIKVFKNDFEVYRHDLSSRPYYSIAFKNSNGSETNEIWGGDPGSEDCYSRRLAQEIYNNWDGTLYYDTYHGYSINP